MHILSSLGAAVERAHATHLKGARRCMSAFLVSGLDAAVERTHATHVKRVFVIGGTQLYSAALLLAEHVLLMRVIEPSF